MRLRAYFSFPFCLLGLFSVLGSSCDYRSGSRSQVVIEIPALKKSSEFFNFNSNVNTIFSAPATVEDFDCLMVNVMGDGITDWSSYADDVQSGSGCGYLGIYSRVVSTSNNSTITLDVDNGTDRYVQVLGVNKTGRCGNQKPTSSQFDDTTQFEDVYELGRAVVDVQGLTSVNISNAYNAGTAVDMRCYLDGGDSTAPTVGTPTITTSNITSSAIDLSWVAATDDVTAGASLLYKVVRAATTAAIDTVAEADAATTVTNWTANLTTTTASSLSASTSYAFVVLVKDAAGNKSLYTPVSETTSGGGGGGGDSTAPTVGTATITTSNITSSSVDLSWVAATDDVTAGASLQYKVVRAMWESQIDTVAEADAATTVTNWTANLTSTTASGLSADTQYAFVVLVKDAAGNKALYTPTSAATLEGTTHTITLVGANLASACGGGGVQYSVSPFGAQTVNDGATFSFTVVRCNGHAAPNLTGANSCGGSFAGPVNVGGRDSYTYTTNSVTADCNVQIN